MALIVEPAATGLDDEQPSTDLTRAVPAVARELLEPLLAVAEPSQLLRVIAAAGWVRLGTMDVAAATAEVRKASDAARAALDPPPASLSDLQDALAALSAPLVRLSRVVPDPDAARELAADVGELLLESGLRRLGPALPILELLGAVETVAVPAWGPVRGWERRATTRRRLTVDGLAATLRDPLARLRAIAADPGPLADLMWPLCADALQAVGVPATTGVGADNHPQRDIVRRLLVVDVLLGSPVPDPRRFVLGFQRNAAGNLELFLTAADGLSWSAARRGLTTEIEVLGVDTVRADRMGLTVDGPGSPGFRVDARYAAPTRPALTLGEPAGTRLTIGALAGALGLGVVDGKFDYHGALAATDVTLRLHSGDGDGLLSALLGASGAEISGAVTLLFGLRSGLRIQGGPLVAHLGADVRLGPLQIRDFALALSFDGQLAAELTAFVDSRLGPVGVTVRRIGARLAIADAPAGVGNAGPLTLAGGFLPPSGASIRVYDRNVQGGGYLEADHNRGAYSGALELKFRDVTLSAVGLITTKADGFSLVVLMTARGFTPLQLGLGLKLTGIGGVVAVNRTIAVDAIRAALPSGSLDSLLFPADVVGNGPKIVADLERYFPTRPGQFVVGPMVELQWGERGLLTALLAVLIEFPAPVRVVLAGRARLTLPDPAAPSADVQLDVLGSADLAARTLALDAVLRNSRIGPFTLTGTAALRASWGDQPGFLLAIGGSHPCFALPDDFPPMRRVTIALGDGDNPRLRLESYVALTSNTVQFGARLDLAAAADVPLLGKFALRATVGFDALFQFDPFRFQVDITIAVALTWDGRPFIGIYLDVTLSGPSPWHAVGRAAFEILGMRQSIPFELTAGEAAEISAVPDFRLLERVLEALKLPSSWASELPPGAGTVVALAPEAAGSDAAALHPLGAVTVRQRIAPLGVAVDRVGAARISGERELRVTDAGFGTSSGWSDVRDHFAPGEFFNLRDDDRLSRPSFEPLVSGARLGAPSAAASSTGWTSKSIELDTLVLAGEPEERRDTLAATVLAGQLADSAHATAVRDDYAGVALDIAVSPPAYTVVDGATLNPVGGLVRLPTYTEAADRAPLTTPGIEIVEHGDAAARPEPPQVPDVDPTAFYKLVAVHSGKLLEVKDFGLSDGAPVQQGPERGRGNQYWRFAPVGDGSYMIVAEHSRRMLDVVGVGSANGSRIQQWLATQGPNQRWRLQRSGTGGGYRITTVNGGRCLDVMGGEAAVHDGVPVQLWDWLGGRNQLWRLVEVSRGAVLRERVQARAYQRWVARNRPIGNPLTDWLPAEADVLRPVIELEAWLMYQRRGRAPGGALADWLAAEREVRGWIRQP